MEKQPLLSKGHTSEVKPLQESSQETSESWFWVPIITVIREILAAFTIWVTKLEVKVLPQHASHAAAAERDPWTTYIKTQAEDGEDINLEALIDTGADGNLISAALAEELGLKIAKGPDHERVFKDAQGPEVHTEGTVQIAYEAGHHSWSPTDVDVTTFYVIRDFHQQLVLGRPTLQHLSVLSVDPLYLVTPSGRRKDIPKDSKDRDTILPCGKLYVSQAHLAQGQIRGPVKRPHH